tara:strand:- start:223 stop:531 length:309 start_codon:yes stop_codon:yes gene_type:complete
MDKDIKKLWVDALNSGDYQQNYGMLKKGECYCCLGVLTDIHAQHASIPFKDSAGLLNHKVMEWADLNSNNPRVGKWRSKLAVINDREKLNFKQIAKLIDKHL